ncbi:bifunctional DNA primase/polymerase [Kitasatospora sp. NPDC018058]|uniref:bifunctional DNA primase/polymerase n=1 Tax=Kitasatospora sp. NPDC018058 TaxID=3364025 RepID=UPI0037BE7803
MTPPTGTLDDALTLVARGWHVLPLLPDSKRPFGNCRPCATAKAGSPSACPACSAGRCTGDWCHGLNGATADSDRLRRTWPHGALVGIAVKPSGLAVLDVESDGGALLADLVASGTLVPTLTLRSASGRGWHLYYRAANGARHLIHPRVADQVDASNAGAAPLPPHSPVQAGPDGRWPFDVLLSTQARWTGNVLRDDPVADWPEAMTRWLAANTATATDPEAPVTRPVPPPRGRYEDMPGCRHNASFRRRGLDAGLAAIATNPTRGRGADALFAALRRVAYHHGQCTGPCAEQLADDLVAAAVAVGVPEPYAARQRWRAFETQLCGA